MSVDCKIRLPHNIRVDDVAKIIGISLGCEKERTKLSTKVKGVNVTGIVSMPSCCFIYITNSKIGLNNWQWLYHFEPSSSGRLLMPRSYAINLAIGKRLVDFYGGVLDYLDCDDSYSDYFVEARSDECNRPEDGDEWDEFQDRLFAINMLTKEEVLAFEDIAAYKDEELEWK